MTHKFTCLRLMWIVISLIAGVLTYLFSGSFVLESTEGLRAIVIIFSILSTIIIATIGALGDPETLYEGSWRIASEHKREIKLQLYRCALLFYVYLITIIFAVSAIVIASSGIEVIWTNLLSRIAMSLGVFAIMLSFALPGRLIAAQLRRLEKEVEQRKEVNKSQN